MIRGNERLIVVVGMAHSGTTILSYVLSQHPDVLPCVNGHQAWIFENTWLPEEKSEPIQALLNSHPGKRLLLKRPWNCVWHGPWMAREMPDAKFLYCMRSFDELASSWSKPTSFVEDALKQGTREFQKEKYDMYYERAMGFRRMVKNFHTVYHRRLLAAPKREITDIANWLGLPAYTFELRAVSGSPDKNIKRLLHRG
jgi:hypothetical protein